ncbi:MAG: MgtC/SapB family protein [Candidatus Thorarchaeota archaeon]
MQSLFLSAELVTRLLLGFVVGALIGLERQKKLEGERIAGVRSFGLHSLFGTLAAYSFTITGNQVILIYSIFISGILVAAQIYYKLFRTMGKGMTTPLVFSLSFVLGTLVGFDTPPAGEIFGTLEVLAVTVSFIVFLVLGFKEELAHAVEVITREEMISAVELGVIIFLFLPLVPPTIQIGPVVLPAFQVYELIVILLAISFVNYLLVKKFHDRGVYFFGFFGGLANSEAAVSSVTDFYVRTERKGMGKISLSVILANLSMVLRNGFLLVLVDTSFQLFQLYLIPVAILITVSVLRMVFESQTEDTPGTQLYDTKLVSPFEFGAALRFGAIFVGVYLIQLFLTEAFSDFGFVVAALVGGLVSAGAVVAGAAALFVTGSIPLSTAFMAVILATTMSVLNKIIYVYISDRETGLLKMVARDSLIVGLMLLIYLLSITTGLFPPS